MTVKRNLRIASGVGPASCEQLDQWADEHERMWDRTVRVGAIAFGLGLIGLGSLAVAEGFQAVHARSHMSAGQSGNLGLSGLALDLLGSLAGVLAVVLMGWHYVDRRNLRPANPYRPIDIPLAELEKTNAAYPGALAYLDAIRHQRRPVVQHDIDVLAMIRRQQRSGQGG